MSLGPRLTCLSKLCAARQLLGEVRSAPLTETDREAAGQSTMDPLLDQLTRQIWDLSTSINAELPPTVFFNLEGNLTVDPTRTREVPT